jgi:hypothetical protein
MFDSTAEPSPFFVFAHGSNAEDARYETPQSRLIAAASAGDIAAIERALAEPAPRLDLDHPLRLAAKHRHRDAVRLLLSRGACLARAFSPNHTPARPGKREQLTRFLASCGLDAEFILALPRPRGPRLHAARRARVARKSAQRNTGLVRRRRMAAEREAWARRRESHLVRRALKHQDGLLAEILAIASIGEPGQGGLERAVRAVLAQRGIADPKRHVARAILHTLHRDGYAPAAEGV